MGVAGSGCNPGTPDAFGEPACSVPAGKRYACSDWYSPILTSPATGLDIGAIVGHSPHVNLRSRGGVWFDVKFRRRDEGIALAFILRHNVPALDSQPDSFHNSREAGRGVFIESDLVCQGPIE